MFVAIIVTAAAPIGIARADCIREQCDKAAVPYAAIAYGAKSTAYAYSLNERAQGHGCQLEVWACAKP